MCACVFSRVCHLSQAYLCDSIINGSCLYLWTSSSWRRWADFNLRGGERWCQMRSGSELRWSGLVITGEEINQISITFEMMVNTLSVRSCVCLRKPYEQAWCDQDWVQVIAQFFVVTERHTVVGLGQCYSGRMKYVYALLWPQSMHVSTYWIFVMFQFESIQC